MEYKIDQCVLFVNMWRSLRPLIDKAVKATDAAALQNYIKNALDIIRVLGILIRQMVAEEIISVTAATQITRELTETADIITLIGMVHLISLASSDEESDSDLIEDSDIDDMEFDMPDEREDMI